MNLDNLHFIDTKDLLHFFSLQDAFKRFSGSVGVMTVFVVTVLW